MNPLCFGQSKPNAIEELSLFNGHSSFQELELDKLTFDKADPEEFPSRDTVKGFDTSRWAIESGTKTPADLSDYGYFEPSYNMFDGKWDGLDCDLQSQEGFMADDPFCLVRQRTDEIEVTELAQDSQIGSKEDRDALSPKTVGQSTIGGGNQTPSGIKITPSFTKVCECDANSISKSVKDVDSSSSIMGSMKNSPFGFDCEEPKKHKLAALFGKSESAEACDEPSTSVAGSVKEKLTLEIATENTHSINIKDTSIATKLSRREIKAVKKAAEEQSSEGVGLKTRRRGKHAKQLKPKNPRKRTKLAAVALNADSEVVDLAQRRDVVNKTILRMLRRYLTSKFREDYKSKFESKEKKSSWYFETIKDFAANLFGAQHPQLNLLQFYVGSIISPKLMTEEDLQESGMEREQLFTFYDCLYKYSHTRLVNLFNVRPIGVIYQYFYEGPLKDVQGSEDCVVKNQELYSTVFEEFLQIFTGAKDVSTLITN